MSLFACVFRIQKSRVKQEGAHKRFTPYWVVRRCKFSAKKVEPPLINCRADLLPTAVLGLPLTSSVQLRRRCLSTLGFSRALSGQPGCAICKLRWDCLCASSAELCRGCRSASSVQLRCALPLSVIYRALPGCFSASLHCRAPLELPLSVLCRAPP